MYRPKGGRLGSGRAGAAAPKVKAAGESLPTVVFIVKLTVTVQ